MRGLSSKSATGSLSADELIDRSCDEFETELKAGRRPDLGSILAQVPAELRETLLIELVLVGLEYARTSPGRQTEITAASEDQEPQHSDSTERPARALETMQSAHSQAELPHPNLLATPNIVGGYELLEELGRGGMGIVYRARQESVDRLVALKIIHGSRFENADDGRRRVLLERFRTEAKAASRLDSEHIATVFEVGQFGEDPFYSMRLVEGDSLARMVQSGPLPADRAARYLVPIARTIAKLHACGVIHRDLKPSNILVEKCTDTPILTDFGLAKLIDDDQNVSLSDEGFGSPPYMAPEQVLHATAVTGAADTYSLGATLYHLLTGRPPFQAATLPEVARRIVFCDAIPPRQFNRSIHRDLETICLKCLEKDESRRYATADDLASDLQRFLERRPIAARRIGSIGRVWRWCHRNPAWTILAISILGMLSASAIAYSMMYARERAAAVIAERSSKDIRLTRSNALYERSQFDSGRDLHESLPWLLACLRLDAGTLREHATRQRIHSVLSHGPELTRLYCHNGPVLCARFSPHGDYVLTGCTDRKGRLWSMAAGKCVHEFAHEHPVRQAAFDHAGKLAATADDNGNVQLWRVESGGKIGSPLAHPGHVNTMAFSADDEILTTVSTDEKARMFRTSDASLHSALPAGKGGSPVAWMALSRNGSHGVSAFGHSRARVWNLHAGNFSPFELHHSDALTTVAFSPLGDMIVTGGEDRKAKVWDADGRHLLFEWTHPSGINHVCWSPDSKRVIATTDDAAYMWPLEESQSGAVSIEHFRLTATAIDPSSSVLLTVGGDRTARLWSLKDGKSLGVSLFHAGEIKGAEFSADGRSVLTFSADGTARTWNHHNHLRESRIATIPQVRFAQASGDGKSILICGPPRNCAVLRVDEVGRGPTVFSHHDEITAASISPDGRRVAFADTRGNIIAWNPQADATLSHHLADGQVPRVLAFAPDNATIASGDELGNVILCNSETGEVLLSLNLAGEVIDVAFSPSGNALLAVVTKAVILIPLQENDKSVGKPIELGSDVRGARFSPDGRFIVAYGDSNRVLVWNTGGATSQAIQTTASIKGICFNETSTKVFTLSQDGTVQGWRLVDGASLYEPIRTLGSLSMGAISPDGQSVALCGDDGIARLWHLETGRPLTIRMYHEAAIRHAQFVGPDRLLTVTDRGDIQVADIGPESLAIEELDAIAQALCGCYIDAAGELVPLTRQELTARCREFVK